MSRRGLSLIGGILENMRVIYRNAVEHQPGGENLVPHRFQPGETTSTQIVDRRMAVVDFEEPQIFDRLHFIRTEGPVEVRMIDVWYAFNATDGVHVVLNRAGKAVAVLRLDQFFDVETVDMNWFLLEIISDLFAGYQEKLLRCAEDRVQATNFGQIIVVGQNQEV